MPPSTSAAPTPPRPTQVIEDATMAKQQGTEVVDQSEADSIAQKKQPDSGLKNYLVSPPIPGLLLTILMLDLESLHVRHQAGRTFHSAQHYHVHWFRYCISTDGKTALQR
jgi:hypothetical protein